ncbi:hypothetical protein SRB5_04880 [Streptomyces sp. RB5]|uniref:Membrane-associated oxidoreductase n=1 Tax=Streptomyces smaragdinus TaxID=2585196 RepID=A0A7K0CAA1_9ACTN|nr:hypothetical protein [Streptomyces smaragdinus]MQY10380.1 hypothetical protein [Streptomyces smaragdinus]
MLPEELTGAERLLWEAFPEGRRVDLRTGDAAADDPAGAAGWGPERTVRAEVVAALLLGARESVAGHVAAVHLLGARITGTLELDNADVDCHLRIRGCAFDGEIKVYAARLRNLTVQDSVLPGVLASYATVEGNLRLLRSRITGRLLLEGARIGGNLNLGGARLDGGLSANRLAVESDILCNLGFTAGRTVQLRSARVGGSVQLRDARLRGTDGLALDAARLRVEGDVSGYRMTARGELGLRGASVTGALFLRAAVLLHEGGRTLSAPGAQFGADVVLDRRFRSVGSIRLTDASVAGHLQLDGADLRVPDGMALEAYGLRVGGDVALRDVRAAGALRISGAQITGRVDLTGARVGGGRDGLALSLRQSTTREVLMRTAVPPDGTVDLRYATLGVLHDEARTWPARIRLDGAAYQMLDTPLPAVERLPWLNRDAGAYLPQPYEHLAGMYRRLGLEPEARRVQLAGQRARRTHLPWYARLWGLVQDVTVGYGYRPAWAVGWLLGLLAAGSVFFHLHPPREPASPPRFEAVIYTLDVLLPVVDFGQEKAHVPQGNGLWVGYLLIAAGWILATAVAAGVARALNRP